MRIGSQVSQHYQSDQGYQGTMLSTSDTTVEIDGNSPHSPNKIEVSDKLDLKTLKDMPDYVKTKFEKDEEEKLEKLALAGRSRLDYDQIDMIKKLEQIEREVVMHEKAHQAAGGNTMGAVSYIYTQGPDYRYYATGGEVEYKLPFTGTPEAMLRAFKGLKNAAMTSADASGQDKRMAAMAEAKMQEIKHKMASAKGKSAYFEQMQMEKQLKLEKKNELEKQTKSKQSKPILN